jgi:ribonuclease VapC
VIVVDSSAVVAILFGEPSADALLERLLVDPRRVMSVASYVETGTVLAGRLRSDRVHAIEDLDEFLDTTGIILAPVDEAQARRALRARIQFGRGMGTGGVLNFGDTFSYALAQTHQAPLLFVGNDFATTQPSGQMSMSIEGSVPFGWTALGGKQSLRSTSRSSAAPRPCFTANARATRLTAAGSQ